MAFEDKLDQVLFEDFVEEIRSGMGSCKLVDYEYSDVYADILDNLEIEEDALDNYLFIEDLTNGGEKGAGFRTLKKAIERARELGATPLVFILSDENQEKLRDWYLSTGLLDQTKLQNVLIAK